MRYEDIAVLLAERGHLAYEGEGVTQLQHAWQCGRLARQAGATVSLQLAAWLHDLGHMMTDLDGSPTLRGIDDVHERRAAQVLTPLFGPAVAEPVGLHVRAKRCLVAWQPGYHDKLSPDSVRSLALQGGPMDAAQVEAFMALPYGRDALRLRAWDDAAKDPALRMRSVEEAIVELQNLMTQVSMVRAEADASHGVPNPPRW